MKKTFSIQFITATLLIGLSIHLLAGNNPNYDLRVFTFTAQQTKILPGLSTEKKSGYNCSGQMKEEDQIGKLAIVALFYQNGCYTDGNYNHNNYQVEKGVVTDNKKEFSFDAYKIYEPSDKAKKFLASHHCIAYKFPTKKDYTVYSLEKGVIKKIYQVKAVDITPGSYTVIQDVKISSLGGSMVYFFAPSKVSLSIYNQYSATAEGAKVKSTSIANIYKYRYQTNYTPLDPSAGSHSNTRQSFLMKEKGGNLSVIWQDKTDQTIVLTKIDQGFKKESHTKLPNPTKAVLAAATNDNAGNYYYFVVENKKGGGSVATIYKVSSSGSLIKRSQPETSRSGLNIYNFGNYMGDMQYQNGKLALFIARTMHASSDGLNHQGGIAVLFDANTLAVTRNFGQTSGHSFDNYLTLNSNNEFLGIDLGDNYPRGINLHKFNDSQIRSKIIYTFKTEHGQRAQSPAGKTYPKYTEISTSGKSYYKWSNDNGTYTALGAVIEVSDGYVVVFTGEPDSNGKSINNGRAGRNNSDPRNIGFIKIVKDFESKSGRGNVVSDDMVLSKGISESGGFYTFGGRWAEQRNNGVQWLTRYKNKKSATAKHLKASKLTDGNILLLWETYAGEGYSTKYQSTYAMKIDKNGRKLSSPVDLGLHVRLNRRDEPLVVGNKVVLVSGNKMEKKLELLVLGMK